MVAVLFGLFLVWVYWMMKNETEESTSDYEVHSYIGSPPPGYVEWLEKQIREGRIGRKV